MTRDSIYSLPQQRVGDFEFDNAVAEVFPDMIARSVPGYASILAMIEQLAVRFVLPGTQVYDLGCSLGAASLLMREQIPADCTIHAVDSSPAMVSRLRERLAHEEQNVAGGDRDVCPLRVYEADVRDFELRDASFIVLNLTLQFIPPQERQQVLQAAFDGLRSGGALLLSEKICFAEPAVDELMIGLHHDFKRAHGYSDLEIAQKRTAIENRLVPETLQQHLERLQGVGFATVATWFQCFNFVSLLAVKA